VSDEPTMERCNCLLPYQEGVGQHAPCCSIFDLPEQWNVAPDGSGISHKVYDPPDRALDEERGS
jgi:hypothetical protein